MITATFLKRNQAFISVSVSGHAGFADAGQDVICASVSASVQMTANLLTEIYHLPAEIAVEGNRISISVASIQNEHANLLLQGLFLQLQLLMEEAPDCIRIRVASAP
ncbi:MAG: ribosomal-processing cysteine protease Prp [Ruminococcus sp.]